jgi:hypothetical protein
MNRKVGGPRPSLSRDQVQRVLRWNQSQVRFQQKQGTLASFSKSLGLTLWQLRRALRPRFGRLTLTLDQKKRIAQWKARKRRFQKQHPSARQLAKSLGVSRSTLFLCIDKKGVYPTLSDAQQPRTPSVSPIRANTALLRAWGVRTTSLLTDPHAVRRIQTRKRGAR